MTSASPARASVLALAAGVGTALLGLGGLSDWLEGDLGLGAVNLGLSTPVAVLGTCVGALLGDTILAVADRHSGWRPGPQAATWALMVIGAISVGWVLTTHLARPMRLDAWTALSGGVLLMLAGAGRHQSAPRHPPSLSAPASRRPALPD